jgi:hypothetical protein
MGEHRGPGILTISLLSRRATGVRFTGAGAALAQGHRLMPIGLHGGTGWKVRPNVRPTESQTSSITIRFAS